MIDWNNEFKKYLKFTSNVWVATKEKGWVRQSWKNKLLTQKLFCQQFFKMKSDERSKIVILKCRQSAISTESMLINLYFLQMFNAFELSFLVHNGKYFGEFRSRYSQMLSTMKRKHPMLINNNTNIRFANGSSIMLYAIKSRGADAETEGRSSSSVALHATEVAFYDNVLPLNALQASLPETNPLRYLIYESSPHGENHFMTEYEDSKFSATSCSLFLSWWHHDLYKVDKRSKIYETYAEEAESEYAEEIQRKVMEQYGYKIQPEQWAWYFWKLHESYGSDDQAMAQEYPSTENEAWELTNELRCYDFAQLEKIYEPKKIEYELKVRLDFEKFQPSRLRIFTTHEPTLTIWELPKNGAAYIVGCDPTGAANPDSDNAVISIWKASKSQIVQVAELVDNSIPSDELVFYLAFLCSLYNGAAYNVEVTGPGMNVQRRMKDAFKMLQSIQYDSAIKDIQELITKNIRKSRSYLYGRADSLSPRFSSLGTKTSREEKELMTDILKGLISSEMITIRSPELIDELKNIEKDTLSARSGHNDDRVMGALLACRLYRQIERRLPDETDPKSEEEQKEDMKIREMFYRIKNTPGVRIL
jgi:hypothetical protein